MNLSLSKRLLLSLVPLLALPLALLVALIRNEMGLILGFGAYGLLVGYCVLAPLASGSHITLRVFLLALAPLVAPLLLMPLAQIDPPWLEGTYVRVVGSFTLIAVIVALIVALVAPLKTRPRYWLLALASGALLGLAVAFYAEEIFCIFCSRPAWHLWLILVPIAALPILLCLILHYGRRTDDSGPTETRMPPVSRRFFVRSMATLGALALISAAMLTLSSAYNDRAFDMRLAFRDEVSAKEDQLRTVLELGAHKDDSAIQKRILENASKYGPIDRVLELSVSEAGAELDAATARLEESQRMRYVGWRFDQVAFLSLLPVIAALFWILFWLAAGRRTVRG